MAPEIRPPGVEHGEGQPAPGRQVLLDPVHPAVDAGIVRHGGMEEMTEPFERLEQPGTILADHRAQRDVAAGQ